MITYMQAIKAKKATAIRSIKIKFWFGPPSRHPPIPTELWENVQSLEVRIEGNSYLQIPVILQGLPEEASRNLARLRSSAGVTNKKNLGMALHQNQYKEL
jgi:hypothetical protein